MPEETQDQEEQQQEAASRPEGLPEKFETIEALASSYAELEKKFHSEKPAGISKEESSNSSEEIPASFDWVYAAFHKNEGKLADTDYEKIEKDHKLDRKTVDRMIEVDNQAVQADAESVYASIEGGRESYDSATKWAAKEYSPEEQVAFNMALEDGGYTRELILKDLMSRWKTAGSKSPEAEKNAEGESVTTAATVSGDLSEKYSSSEQMHKDMNSRQYKNDAAFRDQVIAKAKRSKLLT